MILKMSREKSRQHGQRNRTNMSDGSLVDVYVYVFYCNNVPTGLI